MLRQNVINLNSERIKNALISCLNWCWFKFVIKDRISSKEIKEHSKYSLKQEKNSFKSLKVS